MSKQGLFSTKEQESEKILVVTPNGGYPEKLELKDASEVSVKNIREWSEQGKEFTQADMDELMEAIGETQTDAESIFGTQEEEGSDTYVSIYKGGMMAILQPAVEKFDLEDAEGFSVKYIPEVNSLALSPDEDGIELVENESLAFMLPKQLQRKIAGKKSIQYPIEKKNGSLVVDLDEGEEIS